MGKGSVPRPFSVSQEHYASEWDRIFNGGAKVEQAAQGLRDLGVAINLAAEDAQPCFDALAGDGDTFEEKVSLSDEMQLHGEKHKPEHK